MWWLSVWRAITTLWKSRGSAYEWKVRLDSKFISQFLLTIVVGVVHKIQVGAILPIAAIDCSLSTMFRRLARAWAIGVSIDSKAYFAAAGESATGGLSTWHGHGFMGRVGGLGPRFRLSTFLSTGLANLG